MKNALFLLIVALNVVCAYAQQATELDPKFVKLPRYVNLAAIQAAIPTPLAGMTVFNDFTASTWYYNGTTWINTAVVIPVPMSLNSTSTTFSSVASGSTGSAGYFQTTNTANNSPTLSVATSGTGNAANLYINNASNSNNTMNVYTNGTGKAGEFWITNSGNSSSTISAITDGVGYAGYFNSTNISNPNTTLMATTYGLGRAGYFGITNTSNSTVSLQSETNGGGTAFEAKTTGTGNAGNFRIQNAINSSSALYATTNGTGNAANIAISNSTNGMAALKVSTSGTGAAGFFEITNASSNYTALYTTTNGTGYALITGAGNVGIGTSIPTAKLEVAGFTKLGDDATAPKIKIKKITGVGPATDSNKPIGHDLADASKILSVQIFMEYGPTPSPTKTIPPNYTLVSGHEYQFEIDGPSILITNKTGNSANIGNKVFRMLITYEQ